MIQYEAFYMMLNVFGFFLTVYQRSKYILYFYEHLLIHGVLLALSQ